MRFHDRPDAGRQLGERVRSLGLRSPVVLGLPRGGVPVAAQVAIALCAPLDVFVARKIGAPDHAEFGIGALAEGGFEPVRSGVVADLGVSDAQFDSLVAREREEIARRVHLYRGNRSLPDLQERDVVVVDDGLATGVTAEAALRSLRALRPRRLVLAAPVCARDTARRLATVADDVVFVEARDDLVAVGRWYENFSQTTDAEVVDLLSPRAVDVREVVLPAGEQRLRADLSMPERAGALVVFAHGAASSRKSLRNRYVAECLQAAGIGTLLLDLLTEAEEFGDARAHRLRFDVDLLARRLTHAVTWIDQQAAQPMPIGLFGASTGAAAALVAAATTGRRIDAVVSRGGRPDLAGDDLAAVRAPTLLIVGGDDPQVLDCNRVALRQLQVESHIQIVEGATHLFEEPGALAHVAQLACSWFVRHLGAAAPARATTRTG